MILSCAAAEEKVRCGLVYEGLQGETAQEQHASLSPILSCCGVSFVPK